MTRTLFLHLLLIGVASAADLPGTTRVAREQAVAQLEQVRTRIATEQAALIGDLQQAVAQGQGLRERLTRAEREAQAASDALAKRLREQDRELALVRQLADRSIIAARLADVEVKRLASSPPLERIEAAIAGLERRVEALPARLTLRLGDESVVGRRGAIAMVPVLRLGEARAVALGAAHDQRGLLERSVDGASWLVTGPPLPPDVQPNDGKAALIPFDATGTAAHQPGEIHRSLAQWIAAGRFFIWPILAVFVIGLAITIERIIALARRRVDPRKLVAVAAGMADGDVSGAKALVSAGATPLDRVLRSGLQALGRPRESREAAVEQALLAEIAQLTRGLPAIAVLAGVAPLLGLLGTVTGMIDLFSVIAAQGSGNAKSLSGGISEALICTQAGMLAAIPLLLAHAWLGRLADQRTQVLEEAACGVLGLSEHGDPAPAKAVS